MIGRHILNFLRVAGTSLFALALLYSFVAIPNAHAVYPLGTEVILYHFEDTATGTTTDAITATTTNSGSGGTAYDGLLVNNASTTAASKLFGSRSAIFSETLDFMRTYFGSGVDPTTQSVSVSFWVNKNNNTCNSGDDDHLFGVSGSPTANRFYIRCRTSTTNKWGYRIQGNAEVFSTNTIDPAAWTHITLVLNASTDTATFYINNVAIGSPVAYTTYTLPGMFYVGNFNDMALDLSQGSGAYIDEVAIYNTALSVSDVNVLYQAGVAGGAVSNLTATAYENRAYLSWTAGTGTTTDYVIEYKLSADSTWTTFSDGTGTTTSTTVTGLTNGSLYNFRVTPYNGEVIGTVSSTVSTTPWYRIGLITPTPTHASTVTSNNTITVYASTTPATASTTDTIRLEESDGDLVSQVSTTTRYGDYNLTHLTNTLADSNLSLLDNSSGIMYVPTTDTLFIVHNRATGSDATIDEVTKSGVLVREITCTLCGDIEGIALVSSIASTTVGGYDHTFLISSENDTSNAEIYRVIIHSTGAVTVNKNDYFDTGITHGANVGLEGIAYNTTTGAVYVAREKTTPALYEVILGSGNSTVTNQICTNLDFSTVATDFSDLFYRNNILYVLSHENNRIIPVTITSTTTCAFYDSDGDGSSATAIDTGDYLSSLAVGVTVQPEGMTWDSTGDTLYVLGEADFLAKYRTNAYTTRHTFTSVANGSYVVKATSLDANSVTANASSTAFTLSIDSSGPSVSMTAPTSGSTVSGSSVTVSATASDDVSVSGVTFKYNTNTVIGSEDTSSPYSLSWDSTGVSDGSYSIIAVARDGVGNYATSSSVTVTVDNDPEEEEEEEAPQPTRSGSSTAAMRAAFLAQQMIAQNSNTTPSQNTASQTMNKPLFYGLRDEQVRVAQRILNMDPDTRVAVTGPGSPGNETGLFLDKTRAALQKFQLKYGIVSSPNTPGYGTIGPATRKKMNEIIVMLGL
ncbi:MAG: SdiA-regulated domain-containing protein [Patescibacteria group bacterium]